MEISLKMKGEYPPPVGNVTFLFTNLRDRTFLPSFLRSVCHWPHPSGGMDRFEEYESRKRYVQISISRGLWYIGFDFGFRSNFNVRRGNCCGIGFRKLNLCLRFVLFSAKMKILLREDLGNKNYSSIGKYYKMGYI